MKFGTIAKRIAGAVVSLLIAGAAFAAPLYEQGFETDTSDWSSGTTRTASGTDGIASASGNYHGVSNDSADYHFFGAGSSATSNASVPFVASIDIYLDIGGGWSNDTRFDYDVALSTPGGDHLRDFVFNGGYYDSALTTGNAGFVFSASNNAGRANSYPSNPGRTPIAILDSGWYTFKHDFFDDGGTLGAELSIANSGGTVLGTWSLGSDPIGDVGGERYGWIAQNEFSTLAYDNVSLESSAPAIPLPAGAWLLLTGVAAFGGLRRRS